METLWRTGLACTVIAIVFATEVAGGRRDEFVQSQGECEGGKAHERVHRERGVLGTALALVPKIPFFQRSA